MNHGQVSPRFIIFNPGEKVGYGMNNLSDPTPSPDIEHTPKRSIESGTTCQSDQIS
jgi:hypothetical protein